MLTTAARTQAVLGMTWDQVDFDRGLVDLRNPFDTTRRKGRAVVPMNATLTEALREAHRAAVSPYVVEYGGNRVKSVKRGLKTAAVRAGLDPATVSPHVLRHTAAVLMAEAGIPMTEISQYLGHRDSAVTERIYARYSPGYLRGAASALEF